MHSDFLKGGFDTQINHFLYPLLSELAQLFVLFFRRTFVWVNIDAPSEHFIDAQNLSKSLEKSFKIFNKLNGHIFVENGKRGKKITKDSKG